MRSYLGGAVWGYQEEFAAAQIELLHGILRTLAAGFGAKKHSIPKPLQVERPHVAVEKKKLREAPRRKASVKEMVDILNPIMSGRLNG